MDGEHLRDLQERARVFYEVFPGAAAAEAWKRTREGAEERHRAAARTLTGAVEAQSEPLARS